MIRCDESHRYWHGQRELLGVTRVIESAGLKPPFNEAWATGLGGAVHEAIRLHLLGDLDEASLDPKVALRFKGFLLFQREMSPTVHACEQIVGHLATGTAGCFDLDLTLCKERGVMDAKTCDQEPWMPIQTAAYRWMLEESDGIKRPRRWGLTLTDAGSYRLIPHNDPGDFAVYKAALTIAAFKERTK